MAKTWSRKQTDKNTQIDALAARRVLRDCYRSLHDLDRAIERSSEWRLRWLTALTLLRTVGHVLRGVDAKRSVFLRDAVREAWSSWQANRDRHRIFFEFIKRERDLALKEYRLGETTVSPLTDGDQAIVERLMLFSAETVPPADLVRRAIAWWEAEIDLIEKNAEGQWRAHRAIHPRKKRTRVRT